MTTPPKGRAGYSIRKPTKADCKALGIAHPQREPTYKIRPATPADIRAAAEQAARARRGKLEDGS